MTNKERRFALAYMKHMLAPKRKKKAALAELEKRGKQLLIERGEMTLAKFINKLK